MESQGDAEEGALREDKMLRCWKGEAGIRERQGAGGWGVDEAGKAEAWAQWGHGREGPDVLARAREEAGTGPTGEIKMKVPIVYVGEGGA